MFLAIVMTGCGGSYWEWSKPGTSLQQAKQDGFECKQISREPYYVPVGGGDRRGLGTESSDMEGVSGGARICGDRTE